MSKSIAMIVKMVGGMNKTEKKELGELIGPMLGMKKGRGGNTPFWIKKVQSVDEGQKGPYALEGNFIRDTKANLEDGEYVVIGVKWPERRYALCCEDVGETFELESGGTVHKFDDVSPVGVYEKFAECLEKAKSHVPVKAA